MDGLSDRSICGVCRYALWVSEVLFCEFDRYALRVRKPCFAVYIVRYRSSEGKVSGLE